MAKKLIRLKCFIGIGKQLDGKKYPLFSTLCMNKDRVEVLHKILSKRLYQFDPLVNVADVIVILDSKDLE